MRASGSGEGRRHDPNVTLALLLTEAIEPTTHRGVLSQLSLEFIKPGKVPAELGATFRRLQRFREAADYTRTFTVPEGDARREAATAKDYIATVQSLLDGWRAAQQ